MYMYVYILPHATLNKSSVVFGAIIQKSITVYGPASRRDDMSLFLT